MKQYPGSLKLHTRATFRIRIAGRLNPSWSDSLGDMAICNEVAADSSTLSILTGSLVDQSALFGVLNNLFGLGFPLISVEILKLKGELPFTDAVGEDPTHPPEHS